MRRMTHFKEMNQKIFQSLYDLMDDYPRKFDTNPRWIVFSSEEKEVCKNLYLKEEFRLENGIISCLIEEKLVEGKVLKYFAIIGVEKKLDVSNEIFVEKDVSKEFFYRIICDLEIKPLKSFDKYKAENEILFYSNDSITDYNGHDFSALKNFFPTINLYEIKENYILSNAPLVNLTGYFLCDNAECLEIQYNESILNKYKEIFESNFESVNYNTLIRSIISIYFKDIFMDIYRCIEYLYKAIRINEIKRSLNSKMELVEIYETITTDLNYKFTEASSLKNIFQQLPMDLKENIRNLGGVDEGKEDEWFYSVRNSLVHGRRNDKEIKFEENQWLELINISLQILELSHRYAVENSLSIEFIHRIQKN